MFTHLRLIIAMALFSLIINNQRMQAQEKFAPPVNFEEAGKRADAILSKMSIDEKIEMIGGHNMFFIQGFEKFGMPRFYLSDATQGVHIRKELSSLLKQSVAFPCPLALTATWNPDLAYSYAHCIGEECRVSDVAVLLGPGMNIYRNSQNGRNFEYFGEDPFLAARMIERYVVGLQQTGTIATLKHFLCNNTDHHRRTSNSIVDERTLHEIYLPAFKAGIDAGAMAVMTSYNQLNGEWCGQSDYVINKLLRHDLGFKWLVMTDWWSVYDPLKVIKSGQDLEMPGDNLRSSKYEPLPDIFVRTNAKRLLDEGKISEADIERMAKSIMRTSIAMGLYDRSVKDTSYLANFEKHETIALQTAREAIVLLRNQNNILPIAADGKKKILLTGRFVTEIALGGGSAHVEGYNNVLMIDALKKIYGNQIEYIANPNNEQIKKADIVLLSIGTLDSEGWDRPFELPDSVENLVLQTAKLNSKTVVIVNTGSGIKMTNWNQQVAAIIYAWYPGQNGNIALAEIISGKTNPSGKLPMTIEKKFEDSPCFPYIPKDQPMYSSWAPDIDLHAPINNITYKEGVFVGYRWYESKKVEPLYAFGCGLSYTTFKYSDLKISKKVFEKSDSVRVEFTLTNTGNMAGAETAQLYVHDIKASVPRPIKELKGFSKVFLQPGESKSISIDLKENDFAYWDITQSAWKTEPGDFEILVGSASNDVRLNGKVTLK
jgi:beta-glucosidase